MNKKLLALATIIMSMFVLTACGGNKKSESKSSDKDRSSIKKSKSEEKKSEESKSESEESESSSSPKESSSSSSETSSSKEITSTEDKNNQASQSSKEQPKPQTNVNELILKDLKKRQGYPEKFVLQDFLFQSSTIQEGTVVEVFENHNSANMKEAGADPNSRPSAGRYLVNNAGKLMVFDIATGSYVETGTSVQ